MCFQKQLPRLLVGRHALKQGQHVAGFVRHALIQHGWREQWVHLHYLLQQSCDGTNRMPDERSQLSKVLSLLA